MARPPQTRAAAVLAKAEDLRAKADAASTRRAYAADVAAYEAWCAQMGFTALPATPQVVGAYLAACGEGYAMSTLRRRVAAIARASGALSAPLDTRHPHIRETLRGIGVEYGAPARQAAALTTDEIRRLIAGCGEDLTGRRDRALLLIGFAAALRRSELVALEVADLTAMRGGLKLLIGRSKTDPTHEGAVVVLARGQAAETCPVRAVQAWLTAASITHGPVFRKVGRGGVVGRHALSGDGVRQILLRRAQEAGLKGTLREPISPHGLRAGFITTAYDHQVPDEQIMGHTRHRSLETMRRYVRRGKLTGSTPAGKLGL